MVWNRTWFPDYCAVVIKNVIIQLIRYFTHSLMSFLSVRRSLRWSTPPINNFKSHYTLFLKTAQHILCVVLRRLKRLRKWTISLFGTTIQSPYEKQKYFVIFRHTSMSLIMRGLADCIAYVLELLRSVNFGTKTLQ